MLGILAAAPAAAIDDPGLPDARVTRGPSCQPGGLVVEVVAGTAAYTVLLATTRFPDGEDEALLRPGETVVLRTGDVEPGETIDGRLEYTPIDGAGTGFVDELDEHTFTRPTTEDCDKATAPPSSPPSPPPSPTTSEPSPGTTTPGTTTPVEPSGTPSSSSARPTPPRPAPSSTATTPAPTLPGRSAPAPSSARPSAPQAAARESAAPVAAGDTIRVRVDGYLPGERVTIALRGNDEVLGSAFADDDGVVVTEVLVPAWTATGEASLDVVGTSSTAAADVPLDVAAAPTGRPEPSLVPLLAAAGALTATGAGLVSLTRRRPGRR